CGTCSAPRSRCVASTVGPSRCTSARPSTAALDRRTMHAHPSAPLDEAVFDTVSHPLRMRMLEVVDLARPTPRLVRVTLAGDDFDGFVSASASDHVKLFVPAPGERVARVPVLGPDGIRPDPNGDRPI